MTKALQLALVVVLAAPAATAAHRLDEYYQATRIALTSDRITVDIDLTPGASVAADIITLIDRDNDGTVAPTEAAAYGAQVLADTTVDLDGRHVAMTLMRIEVPTEQEMRDGMGTIRLSAGGSHRARLSGEARVGFRNGHQPGRSVFAVNALLPEDRTFSVVRQDRDVRQQSARVFYRIQPARSHQVLWASFAATALTMLVLVLGVSRNRVSSARKPGFFRRRMPAQDRR